LVLLVAFNLELDQLYLVLKVAVDEVLWFLLRSPHLLRSTH
jgi:hypothetical protein